jgi:hypothetical protein
MLLAASGIALYAERSAEAAEVVNCRAEGLARTGKPLPDLPRVII